MVTGHAAFHIAKLWREFTNACPFIKCTRNDVSHRRLTLADQFLVSWASRLVKKRRLTPVDR